MNDFLAAFEMTKRDLKINTFSFTMDYDSYCTIYIFKGEKKILSITSATPEGCAKAAANRLLKYREDNL